MNITDIDTLVVAKPCRKCKTVTRRAVQYGVAGWVEEREGCEDALTDAADRVELTRKDAYELFKSGEMDRATYDRFLREENTRCPNRRTT